jgi:hypothetical protein
MNAVNHPFRWTFAALLLAGGLAHGQASNELPGDAQAILKEYRKQADAVQARADAELEILRQRYVEKLKPLQDSYCHAAKLDEAVAIREAIRALMGVKPDPGLVHAEPGDIGKSWLFEVRGSTVGSVWGNGTYTTDSSLAAAVVHAGILAPGQTGVVRVRIVEGLSQYPATTAHDVTSAAWGPWPTAFTVESYRPTGR